MQTQTTEFKPTASPFLPDSTALSRLKKRLWIDSAARRFIEHNKRKWNSRRLEGRKSVVLVDVFDWNPYIYCSSYVANYLADVSGSRIEAFYLAGGLSNKVGLPITRLEKIFESFGAKLTLRRNLKTVKPYLEKATTETKKIISQVKSKADLVKVQIDGLPMGPIIYDTYLKRLQKATVDISDAKLVEVIKDTCLVYYLVEEYFKKNKVKAVITSHTVYVEHGILATLANKFGVPVFIFFHDDDLLLKEVFAKDTFLPRDYWNYKEQFKKFGVELQKNFREQAKQVLENRLMGKPDKGVMYLLKDGTPGLNGYSYRSENKVLKSSTKPKILISLHCFFDAPHYYRWLLFPDFWEWLNHLLTKASETDYNWYVKPHPQGRPENDEIIAEFAARFPKINFLGRKVSNKQIADEGINALFTAYGTVGHELSYLGVPIVTAGDNPHVAYDFNLHARTVEQFDDYVKNAGHLKIDINKDEILEFFYMHFLNAYKPNPFGARCIDIEHSYEKIGISVMDLDVFDRYINSETAEKDKKVKQYFDWFFAPYTEGFTTSS